MCVRITAFGCLGWAGRVRRGRGRGATYPACTSRAGAPRFDGRAFGPVPALQHLLLLLLPPLHVSLTSSWGGGQAMPVAAQARHLACPPASWPARLTRTLHHVGSCWCRGGRPPQTGAAVTGTAPSRSACRRVLFRGRTLFFAAWRVWLLCAMRGAQAFCYIKPDALARIVAGQCTS